MSEHRKDTSLMPDRLPGEAELSELYQENADEQPSSVVDQLILNEARKAVQPPSHLRLISRRWTVPLTLAAGLLVSIGVMTTLEDNVAIEQSTSDGSQANTERRSPPLVAKSRRVENRTRAVFSGSSSNPAKTSQPSRLVGAGAVQERQAIVEVQKPAAAPMPKEFASETAQADSSLAARRERSQDNLQEKPRSKNKKQARSEPIEDREPVILGRRLSRLMGGSSQTDSALHDSPREWLAHIVKLFQADHKQEAEEIFQAFWKRYPGFDDFPDDFPKELLDKASAEAGSD